jgi:cytochrome c nitrite reductase small subunit
VNGKLSILLVSLAVAVLLGVFLGSGVHTFVSARGGAYLSNDPAACVNCHVMRAEYDGWLHGSHHAVAVCNDCHLPHDNLAHKLWVKASNGYHHSKAFTLMNFPDPIQIRPDNARVLEANCVRCHRALTADITAHGPLGAPTGPGPEAGLYGCVRCHPEVGHGS